MNRCVSGHRKLDVRCSDDSAWGRLESPFLLGPLDHLVGLWNMLITVVFLYEQPSPDCQNVSPSRLKVALSHLMNYYPHLTGRLEHNDEDGTLQITSFNAGAELWLATCNLTLSQFANGHLGNQQRSSRILSFPDTAQELLPPGPNDRESLYHGSILKIQHTTFKCGGVALGVEVPHPLCDAGGFLQLTRDLAELYRAIENNSKTPGLTNEPQIFPYLAQSSDQCLSQEERLMASEHKPKHFHLRVEEQTPAEAILKSHSQTSASLTTSKPANEKKVVRFSSSELKILKELATNPNSGDSTNKWVSTYDAISAHLCKRIYQARLRLRARDPSVPKLSPPDLIHAVNLRDKPTLNIVPTGSRYFPNFVVPVPSSLSVESLIDGPLWALAEAIHETVRQSSITSKEEVIKALRWIVSVPDKRKIRLEARFGTGTLTISQWNKFDMYSGMTFEAPPVLVWSISRPMLVQDGAVLFLPTSERGEGADPGAIDVYLSLSAAVWELFEAENPPLYPEQTSKRAGEVETHRMRASENLELPSTYGIVRFFRRSSPALERRRQEPLANTSDSTGVVKQRQRNYNVSD